MNEEQFDELVGRIYDAAVDPDLWPAFLESFSDVFRSRGTLLFLLDLNDWRTLCTSDNPSFVRHVRFDPEYIDSLNRYYQSVNVWFDGAEQFPEGVPVTSSLLYPDADLPKTEWYNDWLQPQGYFYSLGGCILKQGSITVRLTSLRPQDSGPFSQAELAFYGRLMPHLRRACKLHQKFVEVQSLRNADTEILDRLPIGVVLFDRNGRPVFLNRAAEILAQRADGFRLDPMGRCCAENPGETQRMRKLITDATGGAHRRGGSMALTRRSSPRPLSVMVSPLSGDTVALLDHTPGAVLFLCDPDSKAESAEGLLTRLYSLSPAEARLAAALTGGDSVNEYAERHGVSPNTVRTQLKQVLAKTGARRQAELVKMILTGPAILREVRDEAE
jgi:DNA-binding CsgD family transcriptional regulator/PAS domain-containing protein